MKKFKKLVASLLAVLMVLSLAPVTALADDTGFALTGESRFFIVSATDPKGTDLGNFVQLVDSEFAAKGIPSSTVLPIKYGDESLTKSGDIVVKVDGSSTDSLAQQSYKITVASDKITVTGGGAAGAYYGLIELLHMFEKNTTLSKQTVENSPLVEERSAYIDCGRIYFSPELIKALIKTLAWNQMNTLYLDFSNNNATRFFLNEMKVTVSGTSTSSVADVENAPAEAPAADVEQGKSLRELVLTSDDEKIAEKSEIENDSANDVQFSEQAAEPSATSTTYDIRNAFPSDGKYLTESDMNEIIEVANQYGVQIIPTFNSPGHIGGLISLNESLFDKGSANDYDSSCGKVTLIIENEEAYKFGIEVNKLYIDYFASKGCKSYNIAADEATLGDVKYDSEADIFVKYVNELAAYIKSKGMTPRMFNDGVKSTDSGLDKDIIILYWTTESTNTAALINAGHKVVNFNCHAGLYYAYMGSVNGAYVWNQSVEKLYNNWNPGILSCQVYHWNNYEYEYTPTETLTFDEYKGKLIGANFAVWTDYAFNNNKDGTAILNADDKNVVEKIQVVGERCWKNSSTDNYNTWKNSLTTAPGGINVSNYSIDSTVLPTASEITSEVPPEPVIEVVTTKGDVTATKQENGNYLVKVKEGSTLTLKLANSTDDKVGAWLTSDDKVATVDAGKVTFTGKAGTVTITAVGSAANDDPTALPPVYTITFDVQENLAGDLTDIPEYKEGKVSGSASSSEYKYILDTDGVDAGANYLIVAASNEYALRNNNNRSVNRQQVTINGNEATIATNVDSSLWQFSGATSGTIKNGTNNYLQHSGNWNSQSLGISTSGSSWTIENNNNGTYYIRYTYGSGYWSDAYYLRYSGNSFSVSTSQSTVRLYKQVEAKNFTVDATNLEELIAYADNLNSSEFSNWEESGVKAALEAAQAVKYEASYAAETDAEKAQASINSAAQALYEALSALLSRKSVDIIVRIVDESGKQIGSGNYVFKAYDNGNGGYDYDFGSQVPTIGGYKFLRGETSGTVTGETTVTLVYAEKDFSIEGAMEIPITIVDYRADGLLFDWTYNPDSGYGDSYRYGLVHGEATAWGAEIGTGAQSTLNNETGFYELDGYTSSNIEKIEGTTIQKIGNTHTTTKFYQNGTNNDWARLGLVEEQLGANGMPVYTDAAVKYVAGLLNSGYYNKITKNGNSIIYDTFISASASRPIKGKSTTAMSAAFAASKTWDNINNAYDLAWYLLNTFYIPDTNMTNVTGTDGNIHSVPIYGMAVDEYNKIILKDVGNGVYRFDAAQNKSNYDTTNGAIYEDDSASSENFYPIENLGYEQPGLLKQTSEVDEKNRNGNLTLRGESQFVYEQDKNLYFQFKGDDDVYMFINGVLALDIGGAHGSHAKKVELNNLDADKYHLEDGKVATFTFFYMERCSDSSTFAIETNMGLVQRGIKAEKNGYDTSYNTARASGSVIENGTSVAYDLVVTNQGDVPMNQIKFEDTDSFEGSVSFGYGVDNAVLTANSTANFVMSAMSRCALFITDKAGNEVENTRREFTSLTEMSAAVANITLDPNQSLHVRFLQTKATVDPSKMASYINTVKVTAVSGGQTLTDSAIHELYSYNAADTAKDYVVDFGLPLKIENMFDESSREHFAYPDKPLTLNTEKSSIKYGDLEISGVGYNTVLTYTLKEHTTIDAIENVVLDVSYKFGDNDNAIINLQKTIRIIPASTVYYEDDLVTFVNRDGNTGVADAESAANGTWYTVGQKNTDIYQALDKLGDTEAKNYGYDPAYEKCSEYSLGSAVKVTVDSNISADSCPTAKFTFKGTGFDIISLTDYQSGAIFVDVYAGKDTSGKMVKSYIVDNYYGYTQDGNGNWIVKKDASDTLYQIPVMKVSGLTYDEYTAVVTVFYDGAFDHTTKKEYSFWLDAIRIYDPAGTTAINNDYAKDGEGYPQYIKLRNELVENFASVNANLLFIDGAEKADIATYANYGPNNEVYLAKGQAISFKLNVGTAEIASIQIGAKAPSGTAVMVVNGDAGKTIGTATEMYYEISKDANDSITITNTGDGILSLTNLKITYSEKGSVSLEAMSEAEQTNAVMMVRALFAPPAPVVFEPETFTVKLSNSRDVYVRENVKVTVTTSDDVDYITVGDKKITRYTEERTWGGFRKGLVKTGKRIWSYYVNFTTAGEQVISVVAYDENGLASEAVENTVNVKPRSAWRGKTSEWHI